LLQRKDSTRVFGQQSDKLLSMLRQLSLLRSSLLVDLGPLLNMRPDQLITMKSVALPAALQARFLRVFYSIGL
jgi:hypothetical protein